MFPAPKFLFVLIVIFGSAAALLLLQKKLPNKKVKQWTPWLFATLAALFIVYLAGAAHTSTNRYCTTLHETKTHKPEVLVTSQDYFEEGNYQYDRGNCREAIIDYSLSLDGNPTFAEGYNNRAYTYMMMGDYAQALPDLDKAIELRPDYANALMNRGDIYNFYYNIDRAKAIDDYDRVLEIDPNHGSLCGHRMLAMNNGWDPKTYWQFLTQGPRAGCK